MKSKGKKWAALLLAAAMTLSLAPTETFAAGETTNIAQGCGVAVSSGTGGATVVDNGTTPGDGKQWASENMKTGGANADPNATQTHQWLTIDLGHDYSGKEIPVESIKLWYNRMVWPMVYEIQTSSDKDTWQTLVRVERDPFDGAVKNGEGQNIADETNNTNLTTATNTDTITKTSTPALRQDAAVKRYVRFYVKKVNTSAGGDNVCLVEFQINVLSSNVPEDTSWNLAEGRDVTSSGNTDNTTPEAAVNGETDDTGWHSANLKASGTIADTADQTPQWLQIDLGASGSQLSRIKIWYTNNKVWPMLYRVETSDDASDWRTIVSVSRSSADKTFSNLTAEEGLGIANTTDCADVITTRSTPGINSSVAVGRYVRLYIEKTNAKAPGQNVNIPEIQIFGTNPNLHPPVNVSNVLSEVTAANVTTSGTAIGLPTAPDGVTLSVRGSVLGNVVADNGTIGGKNIVAKEVTLLIRAAATADPENYQEKNITVTVPANTDDYPAAWFSAAGSNPKPEVIPAIQEWQGYTGDFTLTKASRIVINDAANVGLQKAAENMKADVKEISGLELPIVTGTDRGAEDIYIESLTADRYDLGREGYVLRASDEGIEIYAPTYTGCIFGTITVEQILWQAEDHLTVPKGVMRDYPAYEVRGVKLDIGRAPYRYQQLKDYAKIMLWYKMSEYDLHINDTENPNASNATDSQNNIGFHRLESDTFPSLKLMDGVKRAGVNADLVDADYYNDPDGFGGNPVYTKQQWKDLAQLTQDYGMYLLTEIDMPGHALAYNQYVEQYPTEAAAKGIDGPIRATTGDYKKIELLDLTGTNAANALKFAKALWNEYTSDGTISGSVVHIGADEYWIHDTATNNAFANFADEMRKVIQGNLGKDTKIRMWGATSSSFSTATAELNKTHAQLAEDYQLEIWSTGYDDPVQRSRDGYQIVNCEQSAMYSCPGRHQRDVPNAEYLFNSWDPTMFGSNGSSRLLYGDPNLLGAKAVVWGEQTQEGLTERDVHQRVLRAIAITAEKAWSGTQQSEGTFSDYEMRFNRLAEGPGTQIAMEVPSATSLVLDYDFNDLSADKLTVFDASGNGYNAALNAAGTVDEDGWLTFDGSTLLTTPLKTLSYPYTVTFDLKAGSGNTTESSLFSGYDGRIQVSGYNGHMSANNSSFIRDFNYTVPTDSTAVNITLVGTMQATRLYVNGQLVTFLSQTGNSFQDGVATGAITSYFSSVPLPLEKLGQDFHGQLANVKVYNKALSAAEVAAIYAGTDNGLVNVAQNAIAGGSSFHTGDGYDGQSNANQRTGVAQKAVDGEEEEMYSFWRADHSDSALTVDLGQTRTVSQIVAHWRGTAPGSSFQTSADGTAWTGFTNGTAADARFVKVTATGAGDLQELLVYEQVDKTALDDALTIAEAIVAEDALDFESRGVKKTLFDAVVFARAVKASPLATIAETDKAVRQLQAALEKYEIGLSDNAELSALSLSAGTLSPAFAATTTSYTAGVANSVTSVTVTATAAEEGATVVIKMGDTVCENGAVDLAVGTNVITVEVTAVDGQTTKTYTVTVTRAAATTGSTTKPSNTTKPSTTTNTTTTEAGDKITTVTNNRTGTVTETTEKADGTVAVVETKANGTVTETVTDPEGAKVKKVTDPEKNVEITVTDPEGEVLAEVTIPAEIPAPETSFADVPTGHWAEDSINTVAALGLVNGVGEDRYDLVTPMTRGSLATVLYRLSNGKSNYQVSFTDVESGKYYAEGVAWAAKVGVVTGISENFFAPDNTITREQLAVMLARYAKLIGLDTKAEAKSLNAFSDGGNTGAWAVDGMAWCVETGILQGKGGSTLDPTADVSRAEVAVMLQRFVELMK